MTDDEDMMKAFELFMISGGQIPTKSDPNCSEGESKSESISYERIRKNYGAKAEKRYWQIFKRFCTTLRNEWFEADNCLVDIVHSIENIRTRLPTEVKLLDRFRQENAHQTSLGTHQRGDGGILLNCDDVNSALSHDLLQHEKMLFSMRKMLSNLADSQEKMGRQMDDMIYHHLEVVSYYNENCEDCDSSTDGNFGAGVPLVEDMNDVFIMLSRELYRKQCMSLLVFQSVNDSMLVRADDGVLTDSSTSGVLENDGDARNKDVIPKDWSRESNRSCINVQRLMIILKKSEET